MHAGNAHDASDSDIPLMLQKVTHAKPPDISCTSVHDTLAALKNSPESRVIRAEVDSRRKEHGSNEVTERKRRPGATSVAGSRFLPMPT